MNTSTEALIVARDALEEIALAGMSGTGQESEDGMRAWHARRAWEFLGIAARALDPVRAALAATPEQVVKPRWLIARQTVIDDIPGEPPSLGYTVFSDSFTTFGSFPEASDAIKELGLPLGWVAMKTNQEPWASLFPGAVADFSTVAASAGSFQARVQPWLLACFGELIAGDREERNHRFLEEALELVQSCRCSASEAHQLVDYVFGRAVGEPAQEVGGVMVTLAALCLANNLDQDAAAEAELARIWTKVEQIRAKQAAKPKHSPLPGPAARADDAPLETGEGDARS